jgi:HEAT repeat protein
VAKKSRTMRRDPYRLNEPSPRIAGGARRPSTVLTDPAFARIRDRARLEQLLLQHDPDDTRFSVATRDMSLLRQMAIEGALTNQVPAIRRGAILLLATSPTRENLELLTELAMSGEDLYVRSHALVALGSTGLKIAAPLLRDALRSSDNQERQAAESGLRLLGARVGPEIFAALSENEGDGSVRQALGRVVAALAGERKTPRRRQTSAREPSPRKAK